MTFQSLQVNALALGVTRAIGPVAMHAIQVRATMELLDYPDLFKFRAAQGWIGLGDFCQALAELDTIPTPACLDMEVLHLRCRILAQLQQWNTCLVVARALAELHPHQARSWIVLAETFYQMGDVQKAYRVAASNAPEFPEAWALAYDAACYACLLGRFEQAEHFFQVAHRVRVQNRGVQSRSTPQRRCVSGRR